MVAKSAGLSEGWKKRIVGYSDVPVGQLVKNPLNFRKHPKAQKDALRAVMKTIGIVSPVLVNRVTGHLIDGHLRLELALEDKTPVLSVAFVELTEQEEKRILALYDGISSMAELDGRVLDDLLSQAQITDPVLNDLLSEMSQMAQRIEEEIDEVLGSVQADFGVGGTGENGSGGVGTGNVSFSGGAVSYGTPAHQMVGAEHDEDILYSPVEDTEGYVTQAVNAARETNFGSKTDGADSFDNLPDKLPGVKGFDVPVMFDRKNPYDIPTLRPDMLLDIESCSSWGGDFVGLRVGPPPYLCNIGSASRLLDLSKTILGFYTEDHKFEHFWQYPERLASKILNGKMLGAIVPNYTTTEEDPDAYVIWQTFRSAFLGRFMQEAGIRIIPDVNYIQDSRHEHFRWAGIPKNAPVLAMQLQTLDDKKPEQIDLRRASILRAIEVLEPQRMLIYGSKAARQMLETIKFEIPVIVVPTFMDHRRALMAEQKASRELVGVAEDQDEAH